GDLGDDRLELASDDAAVDHHGDTAVPVNDHSGRYGEGWHLEAKHQLSGRVENGRVRTVLAGKGGRRVAGVSHVDAEERDPIVLSGLVRLLQIVRLGDAGSAPAAPEVDDHDVTLQG